MQLLSCESVFSYPTSIWSAHALLGSPSGVWEYVSSQQHAKLFQQPSEGAGK